MRGRLDDADVVEVGTRDSYRHLAAAKTVHQDGQFGARPLRTSLNVPDATSRAQPERPRKPLLGPAFLFSESRPRVHQ